MKNIIRIASATAILIGLGSMTQGCIVECHDETDAEGNTKQVCTGENAVKYVGSDVEQAVDYTPGQNVIISSTNGDVKVVGGGGDQVRVTFERFTFRRDGEEEEAKAEMDEDLVLETTNSGDVVVKASRKDGSSSGLGANVIVRMPDGFDGGVEVNQNNGGTDVDVDNATYVDIDSDNGSVDLSMGGTAADKVTVNADNGSLDLSGLSGTLHIVQGNGVDCIVGIAAWGSNDGTISCDSLDAAISFAKGMSGRITVVSSGGIITESVDSDWLASEQNVDNSKSFAFGPDSDTAPIVTIENSGDIVLSN